MTFTESTRPMKTMAVHDGRRLVALARQYRGHGWLLKGFGLCWTDPRARVPNYITGKPDPNFLQVPSKRQARAIMQGLLHQREVGNDGDL